MTEPLSYINENGKRKPVNNLAKLLVIEAHLNQIATQAATLSEETRVIAKLVREMAKAEEDAREHRWP